MAEKAAQLQNYNQELVKCMFHLNCCPFFNINFFFLDIELLKRRKLKLQQELEKDYQEQIEVTHRISVLENKQREIDKRISKKTSTFDKMNDVLNQSELGYSKVVDSLEVLLNYASAEGHSLEHNESF